MNSSTSINFLKKTRLNFTGFRVLVLWMLTVTLILLQDYNRTIKDVNSNLDSSEHFAYILKPIHTK